VRLVCAILLCMAAAARAEARQDALVQPAKDEVLIGPIALSEPVQGVPVNIKSSAFVSNTTEANTVRLRLRAVADLADLRAKTPALFDSIPLPTNNCDHFGVDNIVARIWDKRLEVNGSSAVLRLNGEVDNWTCIKNRCLVQSWSGSMTARSACHAQKLNPGSATLRSRIATSISHSMHRFRFQ
jgi:hypothetical protein